MSLFNPRLNNDLEIRAQKIHGEEYLVWDPGTSAWIPLTGGGGGGDPAGLPYWIQPQSAHIYDNASRQNTVHDKSGFMVETVADGTRQKTSIQKDGVTIDDEATSTGSLLTSSALTFGDSSGNSSYTKVGAKNLNELGARIEKPNPTISDMMIVYDTSSSMFKTTPWRDYLKPSSVVFPPTADYTEMAPTGVVCSVPLANAGAICSMNKTGVTVGSKFAGTNVIGSSRAYIESSRIVVSNSPSQYVRMAGTNITIEQSNTPRQLNHENLGDLMNLYAKSSITSPGTGDQMLLFDATTKLYKYCPVPAGVSVPTYIKPNSIEMDVTSGPPNSFLNINMNNTGEIHSGSSTGGNSVKINGPAGGIDVKNSGGTATIYREDVDVTNKLKNLGTTGATAQMMTYVPSTKAFGYASIPVIPTPSLYQIIVDTDTRIHKENGEPHGAFVKQSSSSSENTLTYGPTSAPDKSGLGAVLYRTNKTVKNGDIIRLNFSGGLAGKLFNGAKLGGRIYNYPLVIKGVVKGNLVCNVTCNDTRINATLVSAKITLNNLPVDEYDTSSSSTS